MFIVSGAVLLISTSDLVSIFLSIELQSYGLYLLSSIYRNSELSTTGGLIYFLLGAKECGILLYLCLLLPNSGDALKILILSQPRKLLSGWSNYSGIVTSQNMKETERGNRGSKSIISKNIVVKEQRVNGNMFSVLKMSNIRCTLMGFERNYQIGILSNQKIKGQFRFFTSIPQASPIHVNLINKLNSGWISGFVDGEGYFTIGVSKNKNKVENKVISNIDWLAGFATAEGCFFVNIQKSATTKSGVNVQLEFNLSLRSLCVAYA